MKFLKRFESHEEGMSREAMCDMLCKCGYEMEELEGCSNYELAEMCKTANADNAESTTYEAKGEKWIQDAIKRPGALRKKMKKGEDKKITKSEIQEELAKLKKKDKDSSKPGVQGLGKKDLTKFRQLQLAKTLKGLKEHQEQQNYMFFGNLETMKNMIDDLLQMDESKIDAILSEHDWASDHISVSAENLEHVYNFLKNHDNPDQNSMPIDSEPSFDETEGQLANKDLEDEIKSFKNFK